MDYKDKVELKLKEVQEKTILLLKEIDKLSLSSILVPYHYMYNEPNGKCKIDLDYLSEENVFKFNYFDNYA